MRAAKTRVTTFACLALLLIAGFLAAWRYTRKNSRLVKQQQTVTYRQDVGPRGTCDEYPFAVVKCGVRSEADYRAAIKDPLVKNHFEQNGIAFEPAHIAVFPEAEYVYVSARKDGRIGWLDYRVRIPANETMYVVSKGHSEATFLRRRCGNLLSFTKRYPLLENQPRPDEMLDADNGAVPVFRDEVFASTGGLQAEPFLIPYSLEPLDDEIEFKKFAKPKDKANKRAKKGNKPGEPGEGSGSSSSSSSSSSNGSGSGNSGGGVNGGLPYPIPVPYPIGGGPGFPYPVPIPIPVPIPRPSAIPEPSPGLMVGSVFAVGVGITFLLKNLRNRKF